jgi:pyrroline-5-carboxylate reductase
MISEKIGFIGCGNMGSAMIGGIVSSNLAKPSQILAYAPSAAHTSLLQERYGISVAASIEETVRFADILFLAVKPNLFPAVIPQIRDVLKKDTLVISVAAGVSIADMESLFGKPVKIVRAMPNTPALVLEAMSAISCNALVGDDALSLAVRLFESFGKCEVVPESMMDAVVGVSGSSPAYVYLFIEAMADAAVADGMPRSLAYKFAAQSVLGAAAMVLESGSHPGQLKDAVCSPGGTTIEAVAKLEELGLRHTVIAAQRACTEKSRTMSKKNE